MPSKRTMLNGFFSDSEWFGNSIHLSGVGHTRETCFPSQGQVRSSATCGKRIHFR